MAEITDLLRAVEAGDAQASKQLYERVYGDLKRMAQARLSGNLPARELDATSLVHETFVRLLERGELVAEDRHAFFGYVGRVMRSVLIDHVRERQAQKRGGDAHLVTLTTGAHGESFDDEQLLALNAALEVLERIAPEFHQLIELRYFAGLSLDEVAEIRGTSTRTITREWTKARTFLRQLIHEAAPA